MLAPLQRDPASVHLDAGCARAIARLRATWRVGIISGRSCDDVLARVHQLQPAAVVGDHGLEIRLLDEGRLWVHPAARLRRRDVLAAARQLGGELEEKRWSVSVRGVAMADVAPPPPGVRFLAARHGLDVLPDADWDKGDAAGQLLQEWSEDGPVVYLGDDATDEEAFKRLRPRGAVTVRVAPAGPTAAGRVLKDQSRVAPWLRRLAANGPPTGPERRLPRA